MFTRLYGFETVDDSLLQRVRPAAGSGLAVLGRDLAVLDGASRRPPADHLRRRRADPRLHLRRNVVDGVLRACEAPNAAGEVINVATGGRISLNELLATMNAIVGTNIEAIYKASASRRRQGLAGRHQQGQKRCSATRRSSNLEDRLAATLAWAPPKAPQPRGGSGCAARACSWRPPPRSQRFSQHLSSARSVSGSAPPFPAISRWSSAASSPPLSSRQSAQRCCASAATADRGSPRSAPRWRLPPPMPPRSRRATSRPTRSSGSTSSSTGAVAFLFYRAFRPREDGSILILPVLGRADRRHV